MHRGGRGGRTGVKYDVRGVAFFLVSDLMRYRDGWGQIERYVSFTFWCRNGEQYSNLRPAKRIAFRRVECQQTSLIFCSHKIGLNCCMFQPV